MATPTPLIPRDQRLDDLANRLSIAKTKEVIARQERVELEEEILHIVGYKQEGSTKIDTDHFRISTTGRLTRSVDEKALKDAYASEALPFPLLDRIFKKKHNVDLTQLRYVENNEPQFMPALSRIITTKPGKPSVALKEAS